ncbi:MAG: hypothetical protein ACOYMY_05770 [Prochlorococcaceae cyanobacterium]|jgi:hypothetical protein
MRFLELDLLLPMDQWRQDPAGACRQALAAHGEPLRWAVTAAEGRPDGQQWLRLEAVLLTP